MVTPAGHLALEMLVGDQTILNVAREVTTALKTHHLKGGVIGGIAVFLHGYERTTTDVDVYCEDREALVAALTDMGWQWNPETRQLEKPGLPIPIQILAPHDSIDYHPSKYSELQDVIVVTLAELINMKLSSGLKAVHRAKDLADIVELIKDIPLDKTLSPKISKAYRAEFKRLVDAVEQGL